MRLLPWLLSAYFPLCATAGTAGIAAPGPVDFAHFTPPSHSYALIAPAGFNTAPNIIAPVFEVPAAKLFMRMQAVAAAEPRTYQLDVIPAQFQAAYIVRSLAANFPDIVEIAAMPLGPDRSTYVFYSHSLYGWYAYSVNLNRAKFWADALQQQEAK